MKSKEMWVVWNHESIGPGPPKAVFETAFKGKKAVDCCHPLDHNEWPATKTWGKPWASFERRSAWYRRDGWMVQRFPVGVLEK